MTKDTNGSGPELIVLGRDEAGKPQAARFPAGHHGPVAKAAKAMGLTVCTAESADVAELAKKLPPGRLYSTGRGFVPAVGRSLYGKLVEQFEACWPASARRGRAAQWRPVRHGTGRPRLADQLGRRCCRPPGDRPGELR